MNPKTIGEKIKKRRLDLNLKQSEAAKMIGCDEITVVNWEKGHTEPRINHMAGIVRFLGFNPLSAGGTIGEQLVAHRKSRGLTQKKPAGELCVDPSTLARWEPDEREPRGLAVNALARKLKIALNHSIVRTP